MKKVKSLVAIALVMMMVVAIFAIPASAAPSCPNCHTDGGNVYVEIYFGSINGQYKGQCSCGSTTYSAPKYMGYKCGSCGHRWGAVQAGYGYYCPNCKRYN